MRWFALPLNPEPWTVGPLSLGRKNGKVFPMVGKDSGLAAFQEAVKEEMGLRYPDVAMLDGPLRLEFFLWRRLDTYIAPSAKSVQRHVADATNMQKALEDALQGVLYKNDRQVHDVHTVIMEQSVTVEPCLLIHVQRHLPDRYFNHSAILRQTAIDAWPAVSHPVAEPERADFELGF